MKALKEGRSVRVGLDVGAFTSHVVLRVLQTGDSVDQRA